jgi:excisionase family DNA binding protein
LSVKEAASLLGLSERTVREMVHDGRLPAKRVQTGRGSGKGGRVIISRKALEEWLSRPDEPPAARSLRLAWEREAARRPRRAAGAKKH